MIKGRKVSTIICNVWLQYLFATQAHPSNELTECSNVTPLSQASSIGWDYCEAVHMTRTEVVRSEGVVSFSDISTVSTEDVCWTVLICHILDEDRVPDVMINTSHIQTRGSSPGDGH